LGADSTAISTKRALLTTCKKKGHVIIYEGIELTNEEESLIKKTPYVSLPIHAVEQEKLV